MVVDFQAYPEYMRYGVKVSKGMVGEKGKSVYRRIPEMSAKKLDKILPFAIEK